MTIELQIACISAGSALLGSAIGGIITYYTTRNLQEEQWRREVRVKRVEAREELYSEFVALCGRLPMKRKGTKEEKGEAVEQLYSLLGKIRMVGSSEICDAALFEARYSIEVLDGLREATEDSAGEYLDGRRRFSSLAREEIEMLKK